MNNRNFQLPIFDDGVDAKSRSQTPTARLLEATKLSRLDSLWKPKACSVCGDRLDADSDFQQKAEVCRKCLAHYAKVDFALNEHAERRARAARLARFVAGVEF